MKFEYFFGGRRSGKTTQLAELVKADPDGVMVVANRTMMEHVHRVHGVPMRQIAIAGTVSLREVRCNLYIDDLEYVLNKVTGGQVIMGLTMTTYDSVMGEVLDSWEDDVSEEWARDLGWEGRPR